MRTFFKALSKLFRLFLIFIIALIWCRYFIEDLTISLVVTAFITLLVDALISLIFYNKNKKLNLKNSELEKADNYCNKFIFSNKAYTVNFFYNLASKRHKAKKYANYIYLHDNKVLLYPYYKFEEFNTEDLILTYNSAKKLNANKLVICVNKINANVLKIKDKLDIKIIILDKYQTYEKLLKEYNYFPQEFIIKTSKNSFKSLVEYSLNKKRTKGYFIASIILLFSSFIVKYNIYYLIFSSILLILSLFSFINPKFNKKIEDNILD